MFWEMARDFETPEWSNSKLQTGYETNWFCGPFSLYESTGNVGMNSWEASMIHGSNPQLNKTTFETGPYRVCR